MQWPPDYQKVYIERVKFTEALTANESLKSSMMRYYAANPIDWINDWCVTYDPRNVAPIPKTMPFILFPRQKEFITFLHSCVIDKESGLVEKSRDIGATWLCSAYSVWMWLFVSGSSIGWGSRKAELVDKIGNMDSIFEKMRLIIRSLPPCMIPKNYNPRIHATYMKIVNPETGASITGESGDNIGRGGRSTVYFKDEAAHYERPELIEAALGDNTDVQIDISSVNGSNNVFYRRRQAGEIWYSNEKPAKGKTRVFIFDWRDHPAKTQEWYEQRKQKAHEEGMAHVFAQEVDRDYSGSQTRVVIPTEWLNSCVDAHLKLGIKADGHTISALDVKDDGPDKNAFVVRNGVVFVHADDWGEGNAAEAAKRVLPMCFDMQINELYYDSIGVGSGAKEAFNEMDKQNRIPQSLKIYPWNAAINPLNPDDHIIKGDYQSPTNKDHFLNVKAQAWFAIRSAVFKTHMAVTQNKEYPHEELVSFSSDMPKLQALLVELSQATYDHNAKGKLFIKKTPEGGRSPNLADSAVMCYYPIRQVSILDVL